MKISIDWIQVGSTRGKFTIGYHNPCAMAGENVGAQLAAFARKAYGNAHDASGEDDESTLHTKTLEKCHRKMAAMMDHIAPNK